ncbi:unnamed protein product [Oncorhynchus mykiss]|uniref:DUF7817 domain-containing protein n=1 Tax=Oncorhynchus mykiss TaxID=8022 RepID=A0A060Z491_ONCMY|nr:unnamed protein product [Oncorhynchus mykiss]
MQGWEMKPYVTMALRHNYKVLFREPSTWWKNKPRELERRTRHSVKAEKIRWMMENYDRHVTIHSIMGSSHPKLPPHYDPTRPPHHDAKLPPQQDPTRPPQHDAKLPPQQDPSPPHQEAKLHPQQDPSPPHQEAKLPPQQDPSPPHQEASPSQPKSSDKARRDLLGEQRLVQGSERSCPQLSSSLPDVSSVGRSGRARTPGHSSAHGSTESLSLSEQASEKCAILDNSKILDEEDILDLGTVVSEPEAPWQPDDEGNRGEEEGETGIPHCLVESVFSADLHGDDERPVAFSESIGQRVRKERRSRTRKTDSDRLEPASQSVSEGDEEREDGGGKDGGERVRDGGERVRPELLEFVGDWPSEEVLEQRRGGGRNGRHPGREEEGGGEGEEADPRGSQSEGHPGRGPHVTEFQKLLELLQTGVDSFPLPTCPSPVPSLSSDRSLGEGGERDPDSDLDPDLDPNSDLAPNLDSDLDPNLHSDLDPNLHSDLDPNLHSDLNPNLDPDLNPNLNPNLDSDLNPNLKPDLNPDLNPNLNLNPNFKPNLQPDLYPNLNPDLNPNPHRPSPPPSLADTDRSSQTDPQDFAFLWRLDHNQRDNPTEAAGYHFPPNNTLAILHGNPSRFLPEVSAAVSAGVAVHPSGQRVVPYRVTHEKGSQVEERELEEGRTRQQNLVILRRHFKLVNRHTLEDLYDACQQVGMFVVYYYCCCCYYYCYCCLLCGVVYCLLLFIVCCCWCCYCCLLCVVVVVYCVLLFIVCCWWFYCVLLLLLIVCCCIG